MRWATGDVLGLEQVLKDPGLRPVTRTRKKTGLTGEAAALRPRARLERSRRLTARHRSDGDAEIALARPGPSVVLDRSKITPPVSL